MTDTLLAPDTAEDTTLDALHHLLQSFRVMQLHHAHVLHHEAAVRGLNETDIRLVFFLSVNNDTGITPKQAGEYLELSTGAVTSLIDRLERRGHIERHPNPDDRRSVIVRLTGSGMEVASSIGAVYRSVFRESIPAEYLLSLAQGFDKMSAALSRVTVTAPLLP
ncbi:MarR family winged helix-turn-helix transcriptional regulator [Curtobacterium sp. RRHDQ10]|uniref:MarR family winged helix-turn-helix transcriptional regulator n=1 Tax=Curtobacterium phyllosphaerae TaxID=3413379 RepID=UPI003BF255A2